MIKGAVFDMDGLMFDTERLVYDNWQRMMDEIGLPYDIEVFKQTVGRPLLGACRKGQGDVCPPREAGGHSRQARAV